MPYSIGDDLDFLFKTLRGHVGVTAEAAERRNLRSPATALGNRGSAVCEPRSGDIDIDSTMPPLRGWRS